MSIWKTYDEIDKQLKKDLLTIPPYQDVNGAKLRELLDSLENPDPSWGGLEGEVLRMITNPSQRAFQIEYRIKPSRIFDSSLKVIESATLDFMTGNYISSYLCLIPVIETALMDWAEELEGMVISKDQRGFNKFIFIKNLANYLNIKKNSVKNNPEFTGLIDRHIKHLTFIIKNVFYQKFEDSETGVKKEFNRNRTLHFLDGLESPIVVRDNNSRIFLLIDIIAELYITLDSELYTENTFYSDPEVNIDFNLRWNIYLENSLNGPTWTDMNIIRFAFLQDDENESLSDERKLEFIKQKKLQMGLTLQYT